MKGSVVEALKNELLFVVRKGGSLSLSLSASHSLVRYGYGILIIPKGRIWYFEKVWRVVS